MSPLERRCRLLLRAWPWRDRWVRGDELVGTMLDVVGEDRAWPPPGLALDMTVAGLRARHRRLPPLATYLAFVMGGRLEYRWHEWMLDRLLAPGWRRRLAVIGALRLLVIQVPMMLAMSTVAVFAAWVWLYFLALAAFSSLVSFFAAKRGRTAILKNHGYSLVGSPPRVVTHLVWTQKHETIANIRLAPVMAAASLPLIGAGVLALVDLMAGPDGPTFIRRHLLLLYVVLIVIGLLTAVGVRAHRVPASPGRPVGWSGSASLLTALVLAAVVGVFVRELPSGGLGFAGGAVGLATAVLAGVLLLEERRLGRPIGLWDVYPKLGPGTAAVVKPQVWWLQYGHPNDDAVAQ